MKTIVHQTVVGENGKPAAALRFGCLIFGSLVCLAIGGFLVNSFLKTIALEDCIGSNPKVASKVVVDRYWRVGSDVVALLGGDSQASYELIASEFGMAHHGGDMCEQAAFLVGSATGSTVVNNDNCVLAGHPKGGTIILLKCNMGIYLVRIFD